TGCRCECVRAPGAKCTWFIAAREPSRGPRIPSISTAPVNEVSGPVVVGVRVSFSIDASWIGRGRVGPAAGDTTMRYLRGSDGKGRRRQGAVRTGAMSYRAAESPRGSGSRRWGGTVGAGLSTGSRRVFRPGAVRARLET